MQIYSWFELDREEWPESLVEETLTWLGEQEARWAATGHLYDVEADMMANYAYLRMEKELFNLGKRILKSYKYESEWYKGNFVYQYYALYYLLIKNYPEAIYWYTKTLETDIPYPYPTWRKMAVCYLEAGDIENADYWLEKYINYMATCPEIWYVEISDHAMYYLTSGRPHKALDFLEPYLSSTDMMSHGLRNIAGKAYLALGMVDKAIEYFREYISLFDMDSDQYIELGNTLYEYKKDLEGAEENYLKAIEISGDSEYTLDFRINAYTSLALMMASCKMWEKSYQFLFEMYKLKYTGRLFEPFESIFSSLPPITDDTMGSNIFRTLYNIEHDAILPHNRYTDERLVGDVSGFGDPALMDDIDTRGLVVLDNSRLN